MIIQLLIHVCMYARVCVCLYKNALNLLLHSNHSIIVQIDSICQIFVLQSCPVEMSVSLSNQTRPVICD